MEYNPREISVDISRLAFLFPSAQPEDEYQALMEAKPFDEPVISRQEMGPLRDIIADCIDMLPQQDRYIVEAIIYEQVSLVELGKRMGISGPHTWRLRNEAYNKLRELLMVDERILDIIGE